MAQHVRVDYRLCESNGVCMKVLPAVFEVREDDDRLHLLQVHPDESVRHEVVEAVRRCPKGALSVEG